MIATVKVLGIAVRSQTGIATAVRRVVDYVDGGGAGEPAVAGAAYYREGGRLSGRARGSGAEIAGLSRAGSNVTAEQLQRLLSGEHAASGRPLLSAVGSASRLPRTRHHLQLGREWFTLTEAADVAGVDVSYLRRLARASAQAQSGPATTTADDLTNGEPAPAMLRAERDPQSGRWRVSRDELLRFLRQREPPTVVIGYDVVCSAPKSLSVAYGFADDELRDDIVAAVNAGVDALVDHLERYAVQGMLDRRNRPGLGLAAASYQHEVSRADEAHLHIHNIVANAVAVPLFDEDGTPLREADGTAIVQWRALDGELFLQHVRTAGFVGAAAMRHELTRRRGVRWGPVRNGVAELAAFPPSLLAAFSTRHGQVHEEFAQLVAGGLFPDGRTEAAAQRRSRASKKVLADDQIRARQAAILAAAGWTPSQVNALLAHQPQPAQTPAGDEVPALVDQLVGPHGVTANSTAFTRRDVYQQVAAWAVDRLDATEISRIVGRAMADPRVVLIEERDQRRRRTEQYYTTEDLLAAEDSLLTLHRQGRVDHGGLPHPLLPADAISAALAADPPANATSTSTSPATDPSTSTSAAQPSAIHLSDEQDALLRAVLTSTDLMRPVIGPAGSGKTTVMRVLARILTERGYAVLGAAHGGRQAEQLGAALDVPSRVVSAWITLLDTADDPTTHWPADQTVLVVDEASQVSTRDAERIARHATRTGTVVILVGDPAQLGSVGAGGWFAHLVDRHPPLGLASVRRQKGPAMRSVRAALDGLRTAVPARTMSALARLADDGHLRLFNDRESLLSAAATDWYQERTAGLARAAAPMMAEHQRDVDSLNITARAALQADGSLTGPVLTVAGRDFQAGDEVITLTQAGHTLIPHGRGRQHYIRTGTIGRITAVHVDPGRPDAQYLQVRFPGRGTVRVGWDYLTHPFPDGRDGGLAHAYALTAHKAQGSTMPTARPLIADDTSRAGLYVMLSRAQHDLRAYLIRRHDLESGLDDENWLPVLPTADATTRLAERIRASRDERLARDIDPHAHAAHHLAATHTLPELHRLRHGQPSSTRGSPYPSPGVVRRAELAAEAALAAAALADPAPQLLARLGPRPASGPHRDHWDRAVTAATIYQAHVPDTRLDDPELPPAPARSHPDEWAVQRRDARDLALAWVSRLGPSARELFDMRTRAVPRDRAIAGIHALLDSGRAPSGLLAQLTTEGQSPVRDPAAILDHRVTALCHEHAVDASLHQLPPPRSLTDLWQAATTLLDAAEIAHLATHPPNKLAGELDRVRRTRRDLEAADRTAAIPEDDQAAQRALHDRERRLDAALTRQADAAQLNLRQNPARYLTDLLGPVPSTENLAHSWYTRAGQIEDYRLRTLGLPYGQPAQPEADLPSHRALGTMPDDPEHRRRYLELITTTDTLDLRL